MTGSASSIISAGATLIGAAASGYSAIKSAKTSTPKVDVPQVIKPATAPEKDDAAILAAKQRQILAMQKEGGRDSTILTETLGG